MKPLAVCIAGPTACGKTAAAVAVCRALNGEVISMDSMQIYRGMDVGTAKPTAAERVGIPHHMIDILPPTAAYSVSEYQRDAGAAAAEILARGKLPVFAGGTGLSLQAWTATRLFARACARRRKPTKAAVRSGGAYAPKIPKAPRICTRTTCGA